MPNTRRSLFYVAGYLIPTGLGLMFAPGFVLRLLFSNREYDDVFPRFAGVLMLALGIVVVEIVRRRAAALYPATLAVRAVIWVFVLGIYWRTLDPFFLVVLAVVGFGLIFTGISLGLDRRNAAGGARAGAAGTR
jgi:hypothetical protein